MECVICRRPPAVPSVCIATAAALSSDGHANSTPQGSRTDWRCDAAAARSDRSRRSFCDRAAGESVAEIVGETIARRTEIVSLKFHTAVVKVSGAMWIQELNLMKSQILARVTASNWRRRRARTALRTRKTEPPRATEITHSAARSAQINRAAGAERSRTPQSIRAPDRSLGPRPAVNKCCAGYVLRRQCFLLSLSLSGRGRRETLSVG